MWISLEARGCRIGVSSKAEDASSTSSSASLALRASFSPKIDSDGDGELSRQELQVPSSFFVKAWLVGGGSAVRQSM